MTYRPIRHALLAAALLVPVAVPAVMLASPAQAFFGGRIVYDPTNHAENLLTAARSLEQINNQIAQLQNQAQMLVNQARNLTSLPFSALQELQQSVDRTLQLLGEAQRIAYDVAAIEEMFEQSFGEAAATGTGQELVASARERWQSSVAGFEDALKVQAQVVGNLDGVRATMDALIDHSQGATGALQAAQAGNQLLALQAQQLADLTAVMAAQGRAEAIEQARRASDEELAREQVRRFLAPGAGYQAGTARMFHND